MQLTTNYQFKMPDQTDNYNIQNQNDNWSSLDTIIKNLNTSVTNAQNAANAAIPASQKGVANGVAGLDANALISSINLPIASSGALGAVKIGSGFTLAGDGTISYSLPVASSTVLGGVKIGSGITVQADGTISAQQYVLPSDVAKIDVAQTWTATQSFAGISATSANIGGNSVLTTASSISSSQLPASSTSAIGAVQMAANPTSGNPIALSRVNDATETLLSDTNAHTIATHTPTSQKKYMVLVYLGIKTAATNVTVTVTYGNSRGAVTNILLNNQSVAVGEDSLVPAFIVADNSAPINVTVTAGTANQVYASASIVGV